MSFSYFTVTYTEEDLLNESSELDSEEQTASAAKILAGLSQQNANLVDINQNDGAQASMTTAGVVGVASVPLTPGVYSPALMQSQGQFSFPRMSNGTVTTTSRPRADLPPRFTRPAPVNYRFGPPVYANLPPNLISAAELGPNVVLGEVDMHVLHRIVEQACLRFASGQAFQHREEDMRLVVEMINNLAKVHKAELEKEKTILARRKVNNRPGISLPTTFASQIQSTSGTPQVLIQSDPENINCLNSEIDSMQRNIQIPNLLIQNDSGTTPVSNPNIQSSLNTVQLPTAEIQSARTVENDKNNQIQSTPQNAQIPSTQSRSNSVIVQSPPVVSNIPVMSHVPSVQISEIIPENQIIHLGGARVNITRKYCLSSKVNYEVWFSHFKTELSSNDLLDGADDLAIQSQDLTPQCDQSGVGRENGDGGCSPVDQESSSEQEEEIPAKEGQLHVAETAGLSELKAKKGAPVCKLPRPSKTRGSAQPIMYTVTTRDLAYCLGEGKERTAEVEEMIQHWVDDLWNRLENPCDELCHEHLVVEFPKEWSKYK
ncbi:hypothetical protein QAD02_014725 [Eretmocerus hayati]|uniref:Uncharacterized protein n=1 Tax=Eretmocerus hayati TaxID=131215 RepID=A0ACC2P638_9HYME|nr:hypothetical protein QAD02_014725 [Eretmocerus hayati]